MSAVILTPIRFAASSYVLRVTANGSAEDLTLSVTAGRNYWLTGDGTADSAAGTGDLCALLATMLNTHTQITPFGTVGISESTGRLSFGGVFGLAIQLNWSHANTTLDPLLLGFTSSDTSSTTPVTSPNMAQGWWVPDYERADDTYDQQPVVGGVGVSLSGLTRVSRFATPYQERDLDWELLTEANVRERSASATEPYNTLEWHWENAISRGYPLRVYDDGTTINDGTGFAEYVTRDLQRPWQRDGRWRLRYAAQLRLRRTS